MIFYNSTPSSHQVLHFFPPLSLTEWKIMPRWCSSALGHDGQPADLRAEALPVKCSALLSLVYVSLLRYHYLLYDDDSSGGGDGGVVVVVVVEIRNNINQKRSCAGTPGKNWRTPASFSSTHLSRVVSRRLVLNSYDDHDRMSYNIPAYC